MVLLILYFIHIFGDGGELYLLVNEGDLLVLRSVNSYTFMPTEDYLVFRHGTLLFWGEKTFLGGPANPSEKDKRAISCEDGSFLFYGNPVALPNPIYVRVDQRYKNELIFRGKSYNLCRYVKKKTVVKIGIVKVRGMKE
ncbi:MAG: hypothetical protein H5T91_07380 [Synergistetes bacterium]|nr:hypothetical protein [Synergistota bacterium]